MGETSGKSERPPQSAAQRWSFGSAVLDERAMQLFVSGRAVELELKPLEVLRYLLQRPGEAVGKEDLIKAVWPGRIISDSALTSTIAKLREALGEEQDAVRTVHGFGYRLDADVRAEDGTGSEEGGPASRSSRRLTAIMFTDLVGYSALAHRDEALAIELLELHRSWVREILPGHGGREIETIGDAFLIEFGGALAAVECAVAIQRRFAEHNAAAPENRRMELRIGIHAGDVEHKDGKVMGDGVNIASRIHGVATPGGICVSEDVHRAVRNRPGYHFDSLGTPALKHIATPLELFQLHVDPDSSRRVVVATGARRWAGKVPPWLAYATATVLVAVLLGTWYSTRVRQEGPPSVAVLPFENLSAEPDSAYFTDGLHDTVLTHLAHVRDLRVISRTSVMQYREGTRNLRQIAGELGVAHIVEGTVQRAGDRLRVSAQLIDTATDAHVWAAQFDRSLDDVFAVQAEIAQQIAGAIKAKLTPEEAARIARVPTRNTAAYELYLRALEKSQRTDPVPEDIRDAIAWLEQAVSMDPGFALAYALLSEFHDNLYWQGFDQNETRLTMVRDAAETALRLDPDLAKAHTAQAIYLYHGSRNYAAAIQALEQARRIAPSDADVHAWLGFIYRRQGRWDEAVASLQTSTQLDPRNEKTFDNYAGTLSALRRYAEADQVYARLIPFASQPALIKLNQAYVQLNWKGNLEPLEQALKEVPSNPDPGCGTSNFRWILKVLRRAFAEATEAILACPEKDFVFGQGVGNVPKEFLAAESYQFAGDMQRARPYYQAARTRLEEALQGNPDRMVSRYLLAFTLAALGERQAAFAEAERALESMPLTRDALLAPDALRLAAMFHAPIGEHDRALDELERSLKLPYGAHAHFVQLWPGFDSLRNDPRYKKLMAEHLPKE